jgi:hypothetical protein
LLNHDSMNAAVWIMNPRSVAASIPAVCGGVFVSATPRRSMEIAEAIPER